MSRRSITCIFMTGTRRWRCPEFHTGKVEHSPEHEEQGEVIHYDNVAIPEIHLPHKK